MPAIRSLGLAAALTAAALLAGCASQSEFDTLGGRIGALEQKLSALDGRVNEMAASDRQAAAAAESARQSAEQARIAAEAARDSSARTEQMFRQSLRK